MSHKSKHKLGIPKVLYEKVGDQEEIMKLIKTGLLSLRVTSLEREITDLLGKIEDSKKRISELPYETERLEEILREAIRDRKELENLLSGER